MNAGRDVMSMVPTGCDDCTEVAQRICQGGTTNDKCRQCAITFKENKGCEAMNAGRDVRSMIPTGCDDCAEVAQRICQASTSSSSGASNKTTRGPCAAGDTVKAVWAGNGE